MEKIVSVDQMREIERQADSAGWSYGLMMDAAGRGVAETVEISCAHLRDKPVLALVGPGNNGGDALVALSYLQKWGWRVSAWICSSRRQEDPLLAGLNLTGDDLVYEQLDDEYGELKRQCQNSGLILDGLLGTGIRLPLRPGMAGLLNYLRGMPALPPVLAIDCPSGVDCETGEAAPETLKCEMTVCMQAVKKGLLRFPAFGLCGNISVVPIGLPSGIQAWEEIDNFMISKEVVTRLWPKRCDSGHKGSFGTVGVLGGSTRFPGAPLLVARGAMAAGCGMVCIATSDRVQSLMAASIPEAIWLPLPEDGGYLGLAAEAGFSADKTVLHSLVVGPGLGLDERTTACFHSLINDLEIIRHNRFQDRGLRLVVDADALRILAGLEDWKILAGDELVLTPHPGEMAALCSTTISSIQSDREGYARRLALERACTVVLKGAFTVVAAADGRTATLPAATSSLAHAGSGDVLAGLIGSLLAQGLDGFEAALTGVWVHAQAGLLAAKAAGNPGSVTALDIAAAAAKVLPQVN